jgi:3-hydroxymyristoyl/3-hydroxydecanoyl-(acyl carrier protein) dehydratase
MSRSALAELNSLLSSQKASDQWPTLRGEPLLVDENSIEMKLHINPLLNYFAGHFPDQPVLPGVVQVHWAGELAKLLFKLKGFTALQGTKFNGMILPDAIVTLALSFNQEKSSVRFKYFEADQKYSLGTLIFSGQES